VYRGEGSGISAGVVGWGIGMSTQGWGGLIKKGRRERGLGSLGMRLKQGDKAVEDGGKGKAVKRKVRVRGGGHSGGAGG